MERPTHQQIEAWYPRIYRAALRMTGNPNDAEDMAQTVFCKAIDKWDRFDGRSQPTTWLHQILLNIVRDAHRRKKTRQTDTFDEWELLPIDAGDERPDSSMQRDEKYSLVREAIKQLPDTLRMTFILTIVDGVSYEDAADLLDVPLGTIASRVYQARRKLRDELGDII